jgi:hypothetical protein
MLHVRRCVSDIYWQVLCDRMLQYNITTGNIGPCYFENIPDKTLYSKYSQINTRLAKSRSTLTIGSNVTVGRIGVLLHILDVSRLKYWSGYCPSRRLS